VGCSPIAAAASSTPLGGAGAAVALAGAVLVAQALQELGLGMAPGMAPVSLSRWIGRRADPRPVASRDHRRENSLSSSAA